MTRQDRAETSDAGPPADLPPVPTYAQVQDDPTALHLFNEQIVAEFRCNGGVVDGPFRDSRVLLLTMTGARSGRRRLTPLEYFSIDGRIILLGSFGGAPRNPMWVHNLRAHPDVKVEKGETAYDAVAHEMIPEEGARLLSVIESQNPRVAGYPKPDRRIPVFELRPMNTRVSAVEVDGAQVVFHVDGTGPGLVLVHGTGGDAESNWAGVVAPLSVGRMVVRPNYSGSGGTSDDGGPLTVAVLAAQVVAAASAAGAVPFDLVGFSLGSAVATFIAAEYPDAVRSLVLLSGFVETDARQKLQFRLWRDLIDADPSAMTRLMLLSGFSPAHLAGFDTAYISALTEDVVAAVNWSGMRRQVELDLVVDTRDQARRIELPTLVIGCEHDQMVPVAHAKELAALIPGARYVQMNCGHLALMENPDEFVGLVLDFLQAPK